MEIISKKHLIRLLSKKINNLREFLYKYCLDNIDKGEKCTNYGLNFESAINTILNKISTHLSDEEKKELEKSAKDLLEYKKINEEDFKGFKNKITQRRLVFNKKNEWHPVNKLNTNYNDIADIISEILIDNDLINIYLPILKSENNEEIKNLLFNKRDFLRDLFIDNFRNNPEGLFKYTNNILSGSSIGEKIENNVKSQLEKNGLKVVFKGGNGNFIDMIFSIDLMVETFENVNKKLWTIQVKSNKNEANKFIRKVKFNPDKYKAVDLVIYPDYSLKKLIIYHLKLNKNIKIDDL
jgi:hypothetical protein